MRDLFDLARPLRDTMLAESVRGMPADISPGRRAGAELSAHLIAVLFAWAAERNELIRGQIRDPDLGEALGYTLGQLVGNVGANYRPIMADGAAMRPADSVALLVNSLRRYAKALALSVERGVEDVSVPFCRNDDGSVGPEPFDFASMMGGGGR